MISSDIPPCNSSDKEHDKWSGDNHTWLANRSAQCGKKGRVGWQGVAVVGEGGCGGRVGGSIKAWPSCSCEPPTAQSGESSRRKLFQVSCTAWLVGARVKPLCWRVRKGNVRRHSNVRACASVCMQCRHTDASPPPQGSRGWQIYRAALQRLSLHSKPTSSSSLFCLSNIALIKSQYTRDNSGDFEPNAAI